ncbi:response regulator [Methylobacterium sp. PvR107]|uniref:response regulator n=1 Tax=Methylobacterium sp. PvR107 TaxID=2806597 RepID=UPI001FD76CF5|nr:response regulator [Methylobacterium sp. PvR107]
MTDPTDPSVPYALVVDDDGFMCTDAMDILGDAEFHTFEASDGGKAMALLAREHALIVLLFTDVQMPGTCNGLAVARETARLWPRIAIAVASGQAHPGPGDMPERARFIRRAVHRRNGARPFPGNPAGRTQAGPVARHGLNDL